MSERPRRQHRRPSPTPQRAALGGPHELGQNALADRRFPAAMAEILRNAPPLPVVELGAGDGAITTALLTRGLSVTAVELDPRAAARLRSRVGGRARVLQSDLLAFDPGPRPHHVIANVPFGITTPLLRRLVTQRGWHTAVLLLQWEVARKRAAVGGATMFTASWWPWYEFALAGRVPARAFVPRPAVDGGILVMRRRPSALVPAGERVAYQRMVRAAFTGAGTRLPQRLKEHVAPALTKRWLATGARPAAARPQDLRAEDWVALHTLR